VYAIRVRNDAYSPGDKLYLSANTSSEETDEHLKIDSVASPPAQKVLNKDSPKMDANVDDGTFATLQHITWNTFDVGSSTCGWFQINVSAQVDFGGWFDVCIQSDLIDATNSQNYFFTDMIVVPAVGSGTQPTIIEQERSFTGGKMCKRCYLEYANVPAGELCKVYYRFFK